MDEQQAKQLLVRYRKGLCSEEESKAIENWIKEELELSFWEISSVDSIRFGQALKSRIDSLRKPYRENTQPLKVVIKRSFLNWPRIAVAASVLFCLAIGGYLLLSKDTPNQNLELSKYKYITPGGYKATLTLASGRQIVLTGAKNGELAVQGHTAIHKIAEGQINYAAGTVNENTALIYNTVTTPRGGQYRVVLPDGSRVWLNAASSISFPTAFIASDRSVTITGEAYFEVTPNKHKPFRVSAGGQTVEVLGTHFNINAYTDEQDIHTTLLEGSVKLTQGNNQVLIRPGQEALLARHTNNFTVKQADLEKAVAWTNGNFVFTHDNIRSIMRQISRWYDVDVFYQGKTAHKDFVGSVSRFDNVAKVLNTLQLTGTVLFKVEGRRITVIAK
ncbi:MAG TPA: FecR domain-containing protein [Pedobacter sp.]